MESLQHEYTKYAEALYCALRDDAYYITMEKTVENSVTSKEIMLRYLEYSMIEAKKYGILHIPKEHEYGVSVWAKPLSLNMQSQKHSEKKDFLLKYMGEKSLKTYQSIISFMEAKAQPLIKEDFWYLSIVGVLPDFQGQGLGQKLVENVLHKSDKNNISTYLETFNAKNIPFYERLGYKTVGTFFEPTTKSEYRIMVRFHK